MASNAIYTVTKPIYNAFLRWLASDKTSLHHAYKNPSIAKQEAWNKCKALAENGKDLRIIGHNSFGFSAAFVVGDNKTGTFYYVTKDYVRMGKMSDLMLCWRCDCNTKAA